jgi:hypothetical protein
MWVHYAQDRTDHQAGGGRAFRGGGENPKLKIALELERMALEDEHLIKRKLYPIIWTTVSIIKRQEQNCRVSATPTGRIRELYSSPNG